VRLLAYSAAMAGLVPAIHAFLLARKKDMDARHKAGHDKLLGYLFSFSFASFHNASISASEAPSSERPCAASARSI
jgi:hypothetical protein